MKNLNDSNDAGGVYSQKVFDLPAYAAITRAQLVHLDGLGLPLEGRSVVDLGAGIGRFSRFFLDRKCNLLAVDGREENLLELRKNYPGVMTRRVDLDADDLVGLGSFDVAFCYGLLYHLSDPLHFMRKIAGICREMLLLETCVCDAQAPIVQLVDEETRNPSQSITGIASRPSPSYVVLALRLAGFTHVYEPAAAPNHPHYQYVSANDLAHQRGGKLLRRIFVASRAPCAASTLRLCA